MRISQLAERGGVPVATVKYYLREGLLPPGRATSATQAEYGDAHVERLALVRALLGPGGLTIARARTVLAVVDDDSLTVLDALATASAELPGPEADVEPDLAPALAHLERWGWLVDPATPALRHLAAALAALEAAGFEVTDAHADAYAEAARRMASVDVETVPDDSRGDAVRVAVVGTILLEPVIIALRRLAQQDASVRRFAASDAGEQATSRPQG
ncbi:MerR family transcriptional regulator [Nocardioides sp. TRM66260-LWL]|uniref:MerR family transcriptional regulator n=1 Tax=Nocardioides sp. TRM66260-LWL TaxID=2874478 RepID=UPI001CC6EBC3|nr:MerR family transcriptional regulator [Nocardioides sp. TRM66260-LWL]MBZ5733469.1 MerR family transcriptional regulator [Nocardioides sp. TRM66260-LWL]